MPPRSARAERKLKGDGIGHCKAAQRWSGDIWEVPSSLSSRCSESAGWPSGGNAAEEMYPSLAASLPTLHFDKEPSDSPSLTPFLQVDSQAVWLRTLPEGSVSRKSGAESSA